MIRKIKATPKTTQKDTQFSKKQTTQLQEICDCIKSARHRHMRILFSVSSGTGKKFSASLLSDKAGKAVYRVDLSTIVSKYIGETEKILPKS